MPKRRVRQSFGEPGGRKSLSIMSSSPPKKKTRRSTRKSSGSGSKEEEDDEEQDHKQQQQKEEQQEDDDNEDDENKDDIKKKKKKSKQKKKDDDGDGDDNDDDTADHSELDDENNNKKDVGKLLHQTTKKNKKSTKGKKKKKDDDSDEDEEEKGDEEGKEEEKGDDEDVEGNEGEEEEAVSNVKHETKRKKKRKDDEDKKKQKGGDNHNDDDALDWMDDDDDDDDKKKKSSSKSSTSSSSKGKKKKTRGSSRKDDDDDDDDEDGNDDGDDEDKKDEPKSRNGSSLKNKKKRRRDAEKDDDGDEEVEHEGDDEEEDQEENKTTASKTTKKRTSKTKRKHQRDDDEEEDDKDKDKERGSDEEEDGDDEEAEEEEESKTKKKKKKTKTTTKQKKVNNKKRGSSSTQTMKPESLDFDEDDDNDDDDEDKKNMIKPRRRTRTRTTTRKAAASTKNKKEEEEEEDGEDDKNEDGDEEQDDEKDQKTTPSRNKLKSKPKTPSSVISLIALDTEIRWGEGEIVAIYMEDEPNQTAFAFLEQDVLVKHEKDSMVTVSWYEPPQVVAKKEKQFLEEKRQRRKDARKRRKEKKKRRKERRKVRKRKREEEGTTDVTNAADDADNESSSSSSEDEESSSSSSDDERERMKKNDVKIKQEDASDDGTNNNINKKKQDEQTENTDNCENEKMDVDNTEEQQGDGNGSGSSSRTRLILSGQVDEIPIGSIICAITGKVDEMGDRMPIVLRDDTIAHIKKRYHRQLDDDYDSNADASDVGDKAFNRRMRARNKLYNNAAESSKKTNDKEEEEEDAGGSGGGGGHEFVVVKIEDDDDDDLDFYSDDNKNDRSKKRRKLNDGSGKGTTPTKSSSSKHRRRGPMPSRMITPKKKNKKSATTPTSISGGGVVKKKKKGDAMLEPRPEITILEESFLKKTGTIDLFMGDVERARKEVIRAVRSNDIKALRIAIKEDQLSTLNAPQCIELPLTPLQYAILQASSSNSGGGDNNNKNDNKDNNNENGEQQQTSTTSTMTPLSMLLEEFKSQNNNNDSNNNNKNRPQLQRCAVTTLTSGKHHSRFADHHHRQVQASRGGKQGNNAFTCDLEDRDTMIPAFDITNDIRDLDAILDISNTYHDTSEISKYISFLDMFDEIDTKIYDLLKTKFPNYERPDKVIDSLVHSGSCKLARIFVEDYMERDMGFNYLHAESLDSTRSSFSKDKLLVRSVTKKSQSVSRFTPVHSACINPNTVLLQALLAADSNAIRQVDSWSRTVLHYASSCTTNAPLRYLLKKEPMLDRNAIDDHNITPLMIAAKSARADNVRVLLDIKIPNKRQEPPSDESQMNDEDDDNDHDENMNDIDDGNNNKKKKNKDDENPGEMIDPKVQMLKASDKNGFTALHWGVMSRRSTNVDTVQALIDYGADVNVPASAARNKMTPLHLASSLGDLSMIRLLVVSGAKLGMLDKLGRTTLMLAAKNGHVHVLSFLLNQGIDPNAMDSSKNTALSYAAAYGWDDCLSILLDAGSDPNSCNSWNTSILQISTDKCRNKITTLLFDLDDEIDINYRDDQGRTMLMKLIISYVQEISTTTSTTTSHASEDLLDDMNPSLRHLLKIPKLEIGIVDAMGRNELHIIANTRYMDDICRRKSVALAKTLMDVIMNKNKKNDDDKNNNNTNNKKKMIEFVRASDEKGLQPVLFAAKNNNVPLVQMLLEEGGAELSACIDTQGKTLLHHVCSQTSSSSSSSSPDSSLLLLYTNQVQLLESILQSNQDEFVSLCNSVDNSGYTPLLTAAITLVKFHTGKSDHGGSSSHHHSNNNNEHDDFTPLPPMRKKQVDEYDEEGMDDFIDDDIGDQRDIMASEVYGEEMIGGAGGDDMEDDEYGGGRRGAGGRFHDDSNSDKDNNAEQPTVETQKDEKENDNKEEDGKKKKNNADGKSALDMLLLILKHSSKVAAQPVLPKMAFRDPDSALALVKTKNTNNNNNNNDLRTTVSNTYESSMYGGANILHVLSHLTDPVSMHDVFVEVLKALPETAKKAMVGTKDISGLTVIQRILVHVLHNGKKQEDALRVIKMLIEQGVGDKNELDQPIYYPFLSSTDAASSSSKGLEDEVDKHIKNIQRLCTLLSIDDDSNEEDNLPEALLALADAVRRANAQKNNDWKPRLLLHGLIDTVKPEIFSSLVRDLDLDYESQDGDGNTLLHLAVKYRKKMIVSSLLDFAKCLASIRNKEGDLPLHLAVKNEDHELLSLLLNDDNIEETNEQGRTPLLLAIGRAVHRPTNASVVTCESILLERGANVAAADNDGRNALHHAFLGVRELPMMYNFPHNLQSSADSPVDPIELVSVVCKAPAGPTAIVALDKAGRSPLHYAAAGGGVVSSLLLLKRGAKLTERDIDGNSPLALAILRQHITLSIMLIKTSGEVGDLVSDHSVSDVQRRKETNGVITVVSRSVHSCFWCACKGGHEGLVYILLDEFPQANAIDDAMDCQNFELLLRLIDTCDEDVVQRTTSDTGQTLYHRMAALRTGDFQWLDAISDVLGKRKVDHRATCNRGRTALHYAAASGQQQLCKKLISMELSRKDEDVRGITPFLAALEAGVTNDNTLFMLLQGSKPLTAANLYKSVGWKKPSLIESYLTLESGPNEVTVREEMERKPEGTGTAHSPREIMTTPAIEAVRRKNAALLFQMVKHGADVNAIDSDGLAPIHHAVHLGEISFVHILARLGADLDKRTNNDDAIPPIMIKVGTGGNAKSVAVKMALLECGAKADTTDAKDNTALHVAIRHNNDALAEALLQSAALEAGTFDVVSPDDLSTLEGKRVLVRFGRSFQFYTGFVKDKDTVMVNIPASSIQNKSRDKKSTSFDLQMMLAILHSRIVDHGRLSLPILLNVGIKTPNELCDVNEYKMRDYCDDHFWVQKQQVITAAKELRDMFPPLDHQGGISPFPAEFITGVVDADDFDTEVRLRKALEEKASHLSELERAELRLKHYGAEHLIDDVESITSSLEDGTIVLVQRPGDWCRWHQGEVIRRNANGTYDVKLFCGAKASGCLRMHLRVCPKSLRVEVKMKDTVVEYAAWKNSSGESPLDAVLRPFKFGSFENTKLAKLLLGAGAKPTEDQLTNLRRDSPLTKLLYESIDGVEKETEVMDVEVQDVAEIPADKFKEDLSNAFLAIEEAQKKKCKDEPPPVSRKCEVVSAKLCVLPVATNASASKGFYDVTMTKVDVKGWPHGTNNFYKMQIIHDQIKGVYILLTNWGRVGDYKYGSKYQQTPFQSRSEAVAEFEKIFKSKSGNKWEKRDAFVKVDKKYRLLHMSYGLRGEKDIPNLAEQYASRPTTIPDAVCQALGEFTDPKSIKRMAGDAGLDVDCVPVENLRMSTLTKAEEILFQLKDVLNRQEKLERQPVPDVHGLRSLMDEVAELSSQFYETIPTKEVEACISPLNKHTLANKFQLLHQLRDLCVAGQIIVAANFVAETAEEHPFDYCMSALGVKLQPMDLEEPERMCVEQYFRNTKGHHDMYVRNVFSLTKNGAASLRRDIKNHRLLWHGTSTANMFGILRDGLRIAPPEAPHSGMAYGRGVYCADQFQKAFQYCRANGRAFLLLAEVALGTENYVTNPVYMEEAPSGCHSTVAEGGVQPNPRANVIPCGKDFSIPLGGLVKSSVAVGGNRWQWKSSAYSRLDKEACNKIWDVLSNPDTKFPVEVPIKHDGKECVARIEDGPLSSQIVLRSVEQKAEGDDEKGAEREDEEAEKDEENPDKDDADEDKEDADEEGETATATTTFRRMIHPSSTSKGSGHTSRGRPVPSTITGHPREYILYDESQVRIRYVVEVDCVDKLKRQIRSEKEKE